MEHGTSIAELGHRFLIRHCLEQLQEAGMWYNKVGYWYDQNNNYKGWGNSMNGMKKQLQGGMESLEC